MGVRRQIYLDELANRLLDEQSRTSGVSVSELVRRAIQQCYGVGRRLTWGEAFGESVAAGSAGSENWAPDGLLDGAQRSSMPRP